MEQHRMASIFFPALIEAIQKLCQEHVQFNCSVEVSGYLCLDVDNALKERWVISELVRSTGSVMSESFCAKVFRTAEDKNQQSNQSVQTDNSDISSQDKSSVCGDENGIDQSRKLTNIEKVPNCQDTDCNLTSVPASKMQTCRLTETNLHSEVQVYDGMSPHSPTVGSEKYFVTPQMADRKLICRSNTPPSTPTDDGETTNHNTVHSLVQKTVSKNSCASPQSTQIENVGCFVQKPEKILLRSSCDQTKRKEAESDVSVTLNSDSKLMFHKIKQVPLTCHQILSSQPVGHDGVTQVHPLHLVVNNGPVHQGLHAPAPPIMVNSMLDWTNSASGTINSYAQSESAGHSPMDFAVVKVENEEADSDSFQSDPFSEPYDFRRHGDKKRKVRGDSVAATQCGMIPEYSSSVSIMRDNCIALPTDANSYRSVSGLRMNTTPSSEYETAVNVDMTEEDISYTAEESLSPTDDCTEYIDISYDTDDSFEETLVEESNTYHMMASGIHNFANTVTYFDNQENENKHTQRKTAAHVKLFQTFLDQVGEARPFHTLPPNDLDPLLGKFLVTAKKDNGQDYEPNYLRNIQSSLERHLRAEGYGYSITRDGFFENSRRLLKCKQEQLMKQGKGLLPRRPAAITDQDVEILYQSGQLGIDTPDALLNSMWWCNTVHFGIKGTRDHHSLKWGDIVVGLDEDGQEYLEYIGTASMKTRSLHSHGSAFRISVYGRQGNSTFSSRCPVSQFKLYAQHRPRDFCRPEDPFYLAVNYFHQDPTESWYRKQQIGVNKMGNILKKMAVGAGLSQNKKLTNIHASKHLAMKLNLFNDGQSYI